MPTCARLEFNPVGHFKSAAIYNPIKLFTADRRLRSAETPVRN